MSVPRIAIVGGIYDKPEAYASRVRHTTETMLAEGLRERGWDVTTAGHRTFDARAPYDLVHVHHIGRSAIRMALAPGNARFVYTNHDPYQASDWQVTSRRKQMTRVIVARADTMIPLSAAERDRNTRRYGRALPEQVIIPNGFPDTTYHYAEVPTAGRRRTVLFVGQLIPFKGVDVLLQAFARVNPDADLLLAYQNSALEADYRRQAEELGIADRTKWLGIQSSDELADLYRSSDVFVSASYAEALPSVVIEALMCGCPVIATDVGGVRDIVQGRHPALTPGDVEALAVALREALARPFDPDHRAAISADAIARYRPSDMVDAHARLYRSLIDAPGRPRRQRGLGPLLHPVATAVLDRVEPRMVGRGMLE